jgi:hypothetical protein
VERPSQQTEREVFEHYMRMDPTKRIDRCFIENECASLAQQILIKAQYLELLSARLREGGK